MTLEIKKADINDTDTIVDLEKEIFNMGYSEDFLEFILSEGHNYIAFLNDKPVGYIISNHDDYMFDPTGISDYMDKHNDRLLFTIISFGVKKQYRDKKIGSKLMDTLLKSVKKDQDINKVVLQVRISNDCAINLYKKFGFSTEAVLQNYYSDPQEDAFLMVKHIKKE